MWFLFQGLIVFAVSASNILYHWTPNSYLVGLAGMGLVEPHLADFFPHGEAGPKLTEVPA